MILNIFLRILHNTGVTGVKLLSNLNDTDFLEEIPFFPFETNQSSYAEKIVLVWNWVLVFKITFSFYVVWNS